MKSIRKSMLVAAVLSNALASFAQNPGGQNPGSGSTSADPSNETATTNAGGARTQTLDARVGRNQAVNTDANMKPVRNVNAEVESNTVDQSDRVDLQPDKKRSFWDRVRGRNKDEQPNTVNQDAGRDLQPNKKRSFWDRIRGRNEGVDADQNGTGNK